MSDDELSRYLPRWGDCIAVRAFARQLSSGSDERGVCESDVGEKLRNTLQHKRNMRGNRATAFGNKRAEEKRRVEFGWKACDGSGRYHQVRAKNGGGTRHCAIDKKCRNVHTVAVCFRPVLPRWGVTAWPCS